MRIQNLVKVIRRKGDELFIKWKGYDNSFDTRIGKNDIAI